jgi:hypothetical protein
MINILLSILLVAVVKLGFLWAFDSKTGPLLSPRKHRPQSVGRGHLVETHDVHAIGASLDFGLERSSQMGARQTKHLVYALANAEQSGER